MGSQGVGHDLATKMTTTGFSLRPNIAFDRQVSLASFNLKHFHSFPLHFKTLMFLKNTVPLSFFFFFFKYTISQLGFFCCFLMVRSRLFILCRNLT